jgi:hypothetical protein
MKQFWRFNFMKKIIFAQVMADNGKSVFSGLFDENENPVSVETEKDDGGVTLTIWRDVPDKERRDCGISEEEIQRTCAMFDDCGDCPLKEYCESEAKE